jgi:hypothetical protein
MGRRSQQGRVIHEAASGGQGDTVHVAAHLVRIAGEVPPEAWNRFGSKVLTKLRGGKDLETNVELTASFDGAASAQVVEDLKQAVADVGLEGRVSVDIERE